MNNLWSENIQGILTLYLSRKLRFDDVFKDKYEELFGIDKNKKIRILEIGCGPGALAGALHRWYPNAEIVGIDRDSKFIEFAKVNEPGIEFVEGDATKLPFEDDSFDVTISNTVCEHIETSAFYAEQRRVLKKNGRCIVLSARRGVDQTAECLKETEEEKQFWDSIEFENVDEKYGVGHYAMSEQELPKSMETNGFTKVSTGYAVIDLTPDDPKYSLQFAEDILAAKKAEQVEAVYSTKSTRADEIVDIINKKFETRLNLLRTKQKQWDTYTSITMIIRGEKEE